MLAAKNDLRGGYTRSMIELKLRDDAAFHGRPGGIRALALAESKLEGEISGRGQVAEQRKNHGDFGHQFKTVSEVVGPTRAELGRALIERAEPDPRTCDFQQVRERGRCKWGPVLPEQQVDAVGAAVLVIYAGVGQADSEHAGTRGGDIPVVGAAEVPFEVGFEFSSNGEIGGGIEPFDVGADARGPRLEVKFARVSRTGVHRAKAGDGKPGEREVIAVG